MLKNLVIKNVVLIDKLELDFADGLTALTGETGAGKSILLDALGLALGKRGSASLIRHNQDKLTVIASFFLQKNHICKEILEDNEIDFDNELILKRIIKKDGKTKAFINDEPVSVKLLKKVGETLVEIHGQFETYGLLNHKIHINLLDDFAKLESQKQDCSKKYFSWKEKQKQRIKASNELEQAKKDEDFLRYNLEELKALNPKKDEEQTLSEKRNLLMYSEKIIEGLNLAYSELTAKCDIENSIRIASDYLEKIDHMTENKLSDIIKMLEQASIEISESVSQIENKSSEFDLDPKSLEETEERLFSLKSVSRKHNIEIDDLPDFLNELEEKLDALENGSFNIEKLIKEEENAKLEYIKSANTLSKKRKEGSLKLDKNVNKELPALKLEKASFKTVISRLEESDFSPNGIDKINFSVSTNPMMPFSPIHKVASGGELSRIMLALKVNLAKISPVPTVIFDEIDAGIGGATASSVGSRLYDLAKDLQILVVTHSPQIASLSDMLLLVDKNKQAKDNLVSTTIKELKEKEKQEEIARMLSGETITDEARLAAKSLLDTK